MRIRIVRDLIPSEDLYSLRFVFEEFTNDEKFLFNKYGFITVDLPPVLFEDLTGRRWMQGNHPINILPPRRFFFQNKQSLETFAKNIVSEVQTKLKKYIEELDNFPEESVVEISSTGEIIKINEGAKKVLDRDSPEYREVIELNREAFEKLSKL